MPLHQRLAVRLVASFALVVAITIGYFGVTSYRRGHRAIEDRFGALLQHIATTAALGIDGDAHRRVRTRDDVGSPEFRTIQEHLRRVQVANGLREDLLYTYHMESGSPVAAVMVPERNFTGESYAVPPRNAPILAAVVQSLEPGHTPLYSDHVGQWVSGFAPILDSEGRIAGVLEADYDVSSVQAALDRELVANVVGGGTSLLFAVFIALGFARRLDRSMGRIREGAEAIEAGDYAHRVPVDRADELGLVARRFNRMAEVLSERFHLLKYLPQHTLDAVARRAKDGDLRRTERIDAAIFFSDIRGYTAMSEGLTDEQVVEMLDQYLRAQTDILVGRGATIDKFIGDAVLAVFRGEGQARESTAAALEIQAAVAALNAGGAFRQPVHLGIGVAIGSMVLAEVGSSERRERTLIGSTVNLAARLCSEAGAGEVVVSDAVRRDLGAALEVAETRAVTLKGFAGTQEVHAVVGLGSP